MAGSWHKTSMQIAQEQAQNYSTTSIAGQKRSLSEISKQDPPPFISRPPSVASIHRASSLPSSANSARLTASDVNLVHVSQRVGGPSEYSQRKAISATPTSTLDPLLNLAHPEYGLSPELVTNLQSLGIKSIYPWQKQCLLGPGLLSGEKNLVYSAPTGGGKSLVADVLMLKRVLEDKNAKALLVLPYVALVQEKVRWIRSVVDEIPRRSKGNSQDGADRSFWRTRADDNVVKVVGILGGSRMKYTFADFDIAVCTIEKANSLINSAITDYSITNLKAVVLDELHMIDDDHRGYLLELLTTKLLALDQPVQIVGMSATLSNIESLANWLRGHFYETGYRPIPIKEHLVFDNCVYPAGTTSLLLKTADQLRTQQSGPLATPAATPLTQKYRANPIAHIPASTHKEFQDPVLNSVVALANETARRGYGVLVFAGSRAACETDARWISKVMPAINEVDPVIRERRLDLLGELRNLGTGMDMILEETVPFGVAFHHAGLTTEERDLVAAAYDAGTLKVCVATCGLAAGINLPARRVILHGARMGRDFVGPSMLRQMRGRAGRKGKDEVGETYLCCRSADLEQVVQLMQAEVPQIVSCLNTENRRIQRALLEAITIRLAKDRELVEEFIKRSFMYQSHHHDFISECIESGLQELQDMGFITADAELNYTATQLGQAIVVSALDPDDGIFIHAELTRALRAFVLDGDMHVLYNFTPITDFGATVNWQKFRNEMDMLDESGLRVMGFLGLKPTVINRLAAGGVLKENTPEDRRIARIYRRFYLSFQLRDLCNEMPVHEVARKYDMPRGTVQNLAQTCHGFAAGVIKFCEQLGWGAMAAALDHFSDRLRAGAKSDLLALAKITFIKSRTARVFWENGFRTAATIANAESAQIVAVLMQAQPNKIRLKQPIRDNNEDEDEARERERRRYEDKLRAKAKVIIESASKIWQTQMQQEMIFEEE